jgi:RimJ/RimL family protein N-acetyltransferase
MENTAVILEGSYVRLEALTHDHREGLCHAVADGDLWLLGVSAIPAPEEMTAWIEAELNAQEQGCEMPFTIFWKATNEVVGTTRYCHIESDHRKLEIRTWIAKSWQKTVVNTEAKYLLLQYAFEVLNCIRVEFIADVTNQKSLKALVRIGAKVEGILRNHLIMRGGRYRDSYIFSIIDSEWQGVKKHLQHLLQERVNGATTTNTEPANP